jgi:hypothetical protein
MLGAMIMSKMVAVGQEHSDLFQPVKVGPCVLTNRIECLNPIPQTLGVFVVELLLTSDTPQPIENKRRQT